MTQTINILEIYVDETGDLGYGRGTSDIFGVSFVFHESKYDLTNEINKLNSMLIKLGH